MVHADDDVGVAGTSDGREVAEALADLALVLVLCPIVLLENLTHVHRPRALACAELALDHLLQAIIEPINTLLAQSLRDVQDVCAPDGGLDSLGLLRNRDDQFVVREHGMLPVFLVALHAIEAEREPIRKREIDSFVEVELTAESVKREPSALPACERAERGRTP